jgi:hypothetical protein
LRSPTTPLFSFQKLLKSLQVGLILMIKLFDLKLFEFLCWKYAYEVHVNNRPVRRVPKKSVTTIHSHNNTPTVRLQTMISMSCIYLALTIYYMRPADQTGEL